MRLLLATYAYPPSVGGVERHSQQLCRALVGRGHQVHVVTAHVEGESNAEIDDAGVIIERVSAGRGSRWTKMATYLAAMTTATLRKRDSIDVIHVQQALYPAAVIAVAAKAIGKPLVVRNSGSGEHGAVQLMSRLPLGSFGLGLIRRYATTVSLSPEMTQEMSAAGFQSIQMIPNGVDLPQLMDRSAARRELALPERARIVLYVGRLDREKGTALLADAWTRVRARDALLLIAGDGPLRGALTALERVRLVGNVAAVAPYYAAADVFVLPSESEGISNALLEAMAAALPVVATAVGGNRAVIASDDVGILVQPQDPNALAMAIDRVLQHPGTLGQRARAHVAAGWSFTAMVDAYEALYERLAGISDGGRRTSS